VPGVWWVWLVPSIVVAGALLAVAAGALQVWRDVKRLRRRVAELATHGQRAQAIVADVAAAAERVRER